MVYAVFYVNDEDYSCSWTGNYAGAKCSLYGIYATEEEAVMRKHSLINEHNIQYNCLYVDPIEIGQDIDEILMISMAFHRDDY